MSTIPVNRAPPPARKSFAQVAAAANAANASKEKSTNKSPQNQNTQITVQACNGASMAIEERDVGVATKGIAMHSPDGELQSSDPHQLHVLLQRVQLQNEPPSTSVSDYMSKKDTDTKSVASRTTLTLDEKESLRPDDSASMQAGQEEDVLSPSGSVVADSRESTDTDIKAFREQLNAIDRTGAPRPMTSQAPVVLPLLPATGRTVVVACPVVSVATPAFSSAPVTPLERAPVAPGIFILPPDEKLLEALASPKDRLFVLKIEQDMIDFVRDSKEEFLQLPQTNSFYRMLSHKLADYYMLGHLVDDSMTSVRIFRTPHSRLPPPLIGPASTADGSTPPPTALTRKIMRRGGETTSGPVSRGAGMKILASQSSSKATSDTGAGSGGDDGDEDLSKKDKSSLTREERERMYKEARARIFQDFKEQSAENIDGTGGSGSGDKEVSRSSSASGVKKTKKSRKPKDDFDPRSSYSQYGNQAFQPNPLTSPTSESSFTNPFAPYALGTMNVSPMRPLDTLMQGSTPSYYPFSPEEPSAMNGWSPALQGAGYMLPQTPSTQYFGSQGDYQVGHVYTGQMQPFPSPEMANRATPKAVHSTLASYPTSYMAPDNRSAWPQNSYGNGYAMNGMIYNSGNVMPDTSYMSSQMMYPPSGPYDNMGLQEQYFAGQSPNGFDRQQFNPRSQAFIPSLQGVPVHSPQSVPGMTFANGGSRPSMGNAPQRQVSSPLQHLSPTALQFGQQQQNPHGARSNGPNPPFRTQPQGVRQPQPQGSFSDTISKWGNPSTLPPKPPPSAVPSPYFEPNQQSLPPNPYANAATQPGGNDVGAQVAH